MKPQQAGAERCAFCGLPIVARAIMGESCDGHCPESRAALLAYPDRARRPHLGREAHGTKHPDE